MYLHIQPYKLVHVSGIHFHLHASSKIFVLLCTFLCRTIYSIHYLYFKPRISRSKQKIGGAVAGILLYFIGYCTIRLKLFHLFFAFRYNLCLNYYKPITVQDYIANCVSWVSRLTLLHLLTHWTYEHALEMELICM